MKKNVINQTVAGTTETNEVNNVLTLKQVLNNEVDLSDRDKLQILSACYDENLDRLCQLENLPQKEQKLGVVYVDLANKKLVKEIKYYASKILEDLSKFDTLTEEQKEEKEKLIGILNKLANAENSFDELINIMFEDYIETFGIGEKN